jgi:hypothetical protein
MGVIRFERNFQGVCILCTMGSKGWGSNQKAAQAATNNPILALRMPSTVPAMTSLG